MSNAKPSTYSRLLVSHWPCFLACWTPGRRIPLEVYDPTGLAINVEHILQA